MNEWYRLELDEVVAHFESKDSDGLSTEEIQKRLLHYGPNELIERGIKMYDFIDFNYPNYPHTGLSYWHTTEDTEDKCSRESLEIVGRVVENIIYCFPDIYAPE